MQSDSHESDPRLQKTNADPSVEAGYVDPCIVYLESTLEREIPVLYACWARSSRDVRKAGFKTHLRLENVVVFKWRPIATNSNWLTPDGQSTWSFSLSRHESVLIAARDKNFVIKATIQPIFENDTGDPLGFDAAVRFIDFHIHTALEKSLKNVDLCASKLLMWAPVDWQSISDALASLERSHKKKAKPKTRKSLFRRLVSSVLGKKPVAA